MSRSDPSPNATAWTLALTATICAPGFAALFVICLHVNGWV